MRRALPWVRRWGVSAASLAGGILTLAVFRSNTPSVGRLAGTLLGLWLVAVVALHLRSLGADSPRRVHRVTLGAARYSLQTLVHGLLVFLLPPYWGSTTLDSPNVALTLVLGALALLASVDPWYHRLVARSVWRTWAVVVLAMFAGANLALPLLGMPAYPALLLAAFAAGASAGPLVRHTFGWAWRRALAGAAALGGLAAVAAGSAPVLVPPVPLALVAADVAWAAPDPLPDRQLGALAGRQPAFPLAEARRRGLVARTSILAPAGLRQPVRHVWRRQGVSAAIVGLSPVEGGRRQGFRTRSMRKAFGPEAGGRWSVDVETAAGQLIGRVRFRLEP